jgi:hypothetical protein
MFLDCQVSTITHSKHGDNVMGNIGSMQLDIRFRQEGEPDLTEDQLDYICDILKDRSGPDQRATFALLGMEQARVLLDQLIDMRDDLREAKKLGLDKEPVPLYIKNVIAKLCRQF